MKKAQTGLWAFLTMVVLAFSVFTAGCATPAAPLTTNEKVAVAQTTVTGARQAADKLLVAHTITADEAESINKQADTIASLIKTIHSLPPNDPGVTTNLSQLTTLVQFLNQYINTVSLHK